MKHLFTYTRVKDGKEFKDFFNLNKVIRGITDDNGTVIVALDDFNERVQLVPDVNPKTKSWDGKKYKNLRETVQSEIHLSKEDGERFFKLIEQ